MDRDDAPVITAKVAYNHERAAVVLIPLNLERSSGVGHELLQLRKGRPIWWQCSGSANCYFFKELSAILDHDSR
jgi:hypothetical protein